MSEATAYRDKTGFDSSHRFALRQVPDGARVLDLGGGEGSVAKRLRARGCAVTGIDRFAPDHPLAANYTHYVPMDLNHAHGLAQIARKQAPTHLLLLDIIEHLPEPEIFLRALREAFAASAPRVVITVPNIAFATMRLSLLLGRFSYANAGILDRTHVRFFTRRTLLALLAGEGYRVTQCEGIPPPLPLVLPRAVAPAAMAVAGWLARRMPGLFGYQIAAVAEFA